MFGINIENLKTLKYHLFLEKILDLSIVCRKCGNGEEESIGKFKILGLITNIE